MRTKRVIPIKSLDYATCGNCYYLHTPKKDPNTKQKDNMDTFCWYMPPLPVWNDQVVDSIRPSVDKEDRACGLFKGAQ